MRTRRYVVAMLAAFFTACTETEIPTRPLVPLASRTTEGENLARALALVMSDSAHAAFVRDELRASLYTRHRVAFQTLLASPRGMTFAAAVARELGLSAERLRQRLDPLPTIEFYIESRAQRLQWRGTANVVVAAQLPGERRPAFAFRSNGDAVGLESIRLPNFRAGSAPPVFYLRESDGLALRIDPQPAIPGIAIQDVNDGETGGLFITEVPGKRPRVTQLKDFMARSQNSITLRSCEGCVASVVSPDTTFLWGIHMVQGEDFNDPLDPLELRWYAELNRNSDGSGVRGQWTNLDIGNHEAYFARLPLLDAKIGAGFYIWLKLVENDGWWSDDDYGWWDITSSAHNWWTKSWAEPRWHGGADRCGYVTPTGYYTCPWPTSWGLHYWHEVNFNVAWDPTTPPISPYQGIVGPTQLSPYEYYTWSAENLYDGTGPYSHQWYVDGQPYSTDAVLSTSFGPSSQHTIQVEVSDASGYYSISDPSFWVYVDSGECPPEEIECGETLKAGSTAYETRRARPQPKIRQH